jgi:hypothetical protein
MQTIVYRPAYRGLSIPHKTKEYNWTKWRSGLKFLDNPNVFNY